jgi:hypothetical protein
MNKLLQIISFAALAATIVPSFFYFAGVVGHGTVTAAALAGTLVWFVATPLWMGRKLPVDATQVEI